MRVFLVIYFLGHSKASRSLQVMEHHLTRSSSHMCVDGFGVLPTSKTAKPIHAPVTRNFALSDAP